jgi:hypothetical protein
VFAHWLGHSIHLGQPTDIVGYITLAKRQGWTPDGFQNIAVDVSEARGCSGYGCVSEVAASLANERPQPLVDKKRRLHDIPETIQEQCL